MNRKINLHQLGQDPSSRFPPTSEALDSPNGLIAWGGDLRAERLLNAYRAGIFPWYTAGQPILWWTPSPRCVIFPDRVHLSRRTRRRYNSGLYHLTADTAFRDVVKACAGSRRHEKGTWITPEILDAYCKLHELGYAHSLEVWKSNALAGGIYGLALGSVFFGESMFSLEPDASKIALVALCRQLQAWGYGMLDCQVGNPHLFSMGAEELPREIFEQKLAQGISDTRPLECWRDRVRFAARW